MIDSFAVDILFGVAFVLDPVLVDVELEHGVNLLGGSEVGVSVAINLLGDAAF